MLRSSTLVRATAALQDEPAWLLHVLSLLLNLYLHQRVLMILIEVA